MEACGICGGEVTIRDLAPGVRDWRHLTPQWHRAILGTPMDVKAIEVAYGRRQSELERVAAFKAKPPVPPPLLQATPADDLPRAAVLLRNAAGKAGWDVSATFAIGPWISSDGSTYTRIVESFVLRFARADPVTARAVASWVTGTDPLEPPKFDTAYVLLPTLTRVPSTALRNYLEADVPCLTRSRIDSRIRNYENTLRALARRSTAGHPPKALPAQVEAVRADLQAGRADLAAHEATCPLCGAVSASA